MTAAAIAVSASCSSFTTAPENAIAPDAGIATDAGIVGDAAAVSRPCDPSAPFDPPRKMTDLDVVGTEGMLRLSPDGLIGYFSARQAGGASDAGPAGDLNDVFVATRARVDAPFASSRLDPLGSAANDDAPSITGDGLTVYFASTRPGGKGQSDIWTSTRAVADAELGAPVLVDGVNTATSEASPFVREDGNVLYFSRINASFSHDLWRLARSNGAFDRPELVTELSDADEQYAVVTPDDLVIYYASTSPQSGVPQNLDIWLATRDSATTPFGAPRRAAELASNDDDIPTFITADRCTLYLTRRSLTASGANGTRAIYVAKKTP